MAEAWRNRIVRREAVPPDQLLANPLNARRHNREQQAAAEAVLGETGWVRDVIVNDTTGHVVDGHMRIELAMRAGEPTVPVTFVELSAEEEATALATFDPIADLALTDTGKLRAVRERAALGDALEALVAGALAKAGDPDDLPSGVDASQGREATMDAYLNGDQRQIHLPLLAAEHALVSRAVEAIRAETGAERNADVLFWLLDQDSAATGEEWRP